MAKKKTTSKLKDKKGPGRSPSECPGIAGVPSRRKPLAMGPYPQVKVRQPTARATPARKLPAALPKRRSKK